MRYQFLISAGAAEDLEQCRRDDRWAAARIAVLLREVSSDEVASEALVDDRSYDASFTVKPIWHLQDKRINAYRVRLLEVGAWRLVTAVDHKSQRVALLGVMRREQNYEQDRSFMSRIEKEYDALGFAHY